MHFSLYFSKDVLTALRKRLKNRRENHAVFDAPTLADLRARLDHGGPSVPPPLSDAGGLTLREELTRAGRWRPAREAKLILASPNGRAELARQTLNSPSMIKNLLTPQTMLQLLPAPPDELLHPASPVDDVGATSRPLGSEGEGGEGVDVVVGVGMDAGAGVGVDVGATAFRGVLRTESESPESQVGTEVPLPVLQLTLLVVALLLCIRLLANSRWSFRTRPFRGRQAHAAALTSDLA